MIIAIKIRHLEDINIKHTCYIAQVLHGLPVAMVIDLRSLADMSFFTTVYPEAFCLGTSYLGTFYLGTFYPGPFFRDLLTGDILSGYAERVMRIRIINK